MVFLLLLYTIQENSRGTCLRILRIEEPVFFSFPTFAKDSLCKKVTFTQRSLLHKGPFHTKVPFAKGSSGIDDTCNKLGANPNTKLGLALIHFYDDNVKLMYWWRWCIRVEADKRRAMPSITVKRRFVRRQNGSFAMFCQHSDASGGLL